MFITYKGAICTIHGPYKGCNSDLAILRDSNILKIYPEDVSFFADGIYVDQSDDSRVYIPFRMPKTQEEKSFNDAFGFERGLIENLFHRLKCHRNCFHLPWRHSVEKHQLFVNVFSNIVNIDLKLHPLRLQDNEHCKICKNK